MSFNFTEISKQKQEARKKRSKTKNFLSFELSCNSLELKNGM